MSGAISRDNWAVRLEGVSKRYRLRASGPRTIYFLEDLLRGFGRVFKKSAVPARAEDAFWALRGIDLELHAGEKLGIIGANGAGKSTLLKILSQITLPTEGRVRYRGRLASLLEIGTGFHRELTGRENVFLNGAILGMKRAEIAGRFDEIVEFAGIGRFIDTAVKHYSSGMYVRLAFSVAAHLRSDILVLDEVLAVGDAQFQQKCLGKMQEAASQGRTVIFVSHNLPAVRTLCSRALWLHEGRVQRGGGVPEVIDGYLQHTLVQQTGRIDLEKIERVSHFDGRLRVVRVEFNAGRPLQHGEPLRILIEYRVTDKVGDVAFCVGFSSCDGVRLMSLDSDLSGRRVKLERKPSGQVEIVLEKMLLQPGKYLVSLNARSGDYTTLDQVEVPGQLSVLPGPTTPNSIIRDSGGVRLPAAWEWDIEAPAGQESRHG